MSNDKNKMLYNLERNSIYYGIIVVLGREVVLSTSEINKCNLYYEHEARAVKKRLSHKGIKTTIGKVEINKRKLRNSLQTSNI